MARDRQRGRRRGRRPPGGSPQEPGRPLPGGAADPDPTLDPARDQGVEDVTEDRGPDGTTPAPDPLKHGSPYVDEAKLAEAGGEVEAPATGASRTTGYAEDAVEEPGAVPSGGERAGRPRRGRAVTFLGNSADELRRVQWPDRRHTGQGTAVTLGFVVLAGAFLGLMDAIWQPLVDAIL